MRYSWLFLVRIKKCNTAADNSPIGIYTNKIKNCVFSEIKTDYILEFLSKETIRLLGSTEQVVAKDKQWKCAKIRNGRCNIDALQLFLVTTLNKQSR